MPEGESFDVGEEDGPVSEVEASAASAEPCVRVSAAPLAVVWASAAPGSEVCAVYACGLDEAYGGQGLTRPEAESFFAEPGLYDVEAFASDAFLHLAEVHKGRCYTYNIDRALGSFSSI